MCQRKDGGPREGDRKNKIGNSAREKLTETETYRVLSERKKVALERNRREHDDLQMKIKRKTDRDIKEIAVN